MVALVLAAGLAATLMGDGTSAAVSDARELVDDDARFGTADESGQTFLRVSELLAAEAEQCETLEADRRRDGTCRSYFAGAAYARIASIGVLRCSRPELFDARAAMTSYLEKLEESPAVAEIPAPPRCV